MWGDKSFRELSAPQPCGQALWIYLLTGPHTTPLPGLFMAGEAGLDTQRAQQILASDTYADDVRTQEQFFQSRGIHSVPATIINGQHLISGGQPPEAFEQALRQIAAAAPH